MNKLQHEVWRRFFKTEIVGKHDRLRTSLRRPDKLVDALLKGPIPDNGNPLHIEFLGIPENRRAFVKAFASISFTAGAWGYCMERLSKGICYDALENGAFRMQLNKSALGRKITLELLTNRVDVLQDKAEVEYNNAKMKMEKAEVVIKKFERRRELMKKVDERNLKPYPEKRKMSKNLNKMWTYTTY